MQHIAGELKHRYLPNSDLDYKTILDAYQNHHVLHICLTRACTEAQMTCLKKSLELLNGLQFSSKYERKIKMIKAHIVVTSSQNCPWEPLPTSVMSYEVGTLESGTWTRQG